MGDGRRGGGCGPDVKLAPAWPSRLTCDKPGYRRFDRRGKNKGLDFDHEFVRRGFHRLPEYAVRVCWQLMKMAMTMSITSALFLALVTAVAAGDPKPLEPHPSCDDTKFIGVVSMEDDGTIRMHLRSMVSAAIVESDFLYKPGDSDTTVS
jgi:hypothetical protein